MFFNLLTKSWLFKSFSLSGNFKLFKAFFPFSPITWGTFVLLTELPVFGYTCLSLEIDEEFWTKLSWECEEALPVKLPLFFTVVAVAELFWLLLSSWLLELELIRWALLLLAFKPEPCELEVLTGLTFTVALNVFSRFEGALALKIKFDLLEAFVNFCDAVLPVDTLEFKLSAWATVPVIPNENTVIEAATHILPFLYNLIRLNRFPM